jgi:hypothetical protein
MSSLTLFFCRVSLAEYSYSALLNMLISGNPIWPGVIPEGWEVEWENDDDE